MFVPETRTHTTQNTPTHTYTHTRYAWPEGRNHSLHSKQVNSTDDCCAACGANPRCESFCFYKGGYPGAPAGLCRMYDVAMPSVVPGPGNPHYDSGNLHGQAPKIAPSPPGPSPGPPHPPPPPPPPAPPVPPYEGLAFPKTTREAAAVSSALLHEALAPYLIVAQPNTWFSYAWFYGVQSGWAPCPNDPGACTAPPEWYPDLQKHLGNPLGPALKVGTVYTREFEGCTAVVDLSDRRKSKVTWKEMPHA